jgi:hypothetical protein
MRNKAELSERGLHSWNFRVIKWETGDKVVFRDNLTGERKVSEPITEDAFSVHEIFYDEAGNPAAITEDGVLYDFFDSVEGVQDTLNKMLEDCNNQEPILSTDVSKFFSYNENNK